MELFGSEIHVLVLTLRDFHQGTLFYADVVLSALEVNQASDVMPTMVSSTSCSSLLALV